MDGTILCTGKTPTMPKCCNGEAARHIMNLIKGQSISFFAKTWASGGCSRFFW